MTDELIVSATGGDRRWARPEIAALADGDRVAVAALLGDVGAATHASFETESADYRASIPLDVLRDQAVLVHAVGGEPLADEDGGPFRLLVPDGDTLCWNVKGVARIRLTDGPEPDSVPENPPH